MFIKKRTLTCYHRLQPCHKARGWGTFRVAGSGRAANTSVSSLRNASQKLLPELHTGVTGIQTCGRHVGGNNRQACNNKLEIRFLTTTCSSAKSSIVIGRRGHCVSKGIVESSLRDHSSHQNRLWRRMCIQIAYVAEVGVVIPPGSVDVHNFFQLDEKS